MTRRQDRITSKDGGGLAPWVKNGLVGEREQEVGQGPGLQPGARSVAGYGA